MEAVKVIYEQPLNEILRVCLRLDFLFKQTDSFLKCENEWDIRAAINSIIDILNTIDRPDLKGKLINALQSHASSINLVKSAPEVDIDKLEMILGKLNEAQQELHDTYGKFGQDLRDNAFIANIRQRLITPAGTSSFIIPALHWWLNQPLGQQKSYIEKWYSNFALLKKAVDLILNLVRESSNSKKKIAIHGFYQEALSPNIPYQMIRIFLPPESIYYPEISVGKHRLSVYFIVLPNNKQPYQYHENVEFELSCCRL